MVNRFGAYITPLILLSLWGTICPSSQGQDRGQHPTRHTPSVLSHLQAKVDLTIHESSENLKHGNIRLKDLVQRAAKKERVVLYFAESIPDQVVTLPPQDSASGWTLAQIGLDNGLVFQPLNGKSHSYVVFLRAPAPLPEGVVRLYQNAGLWILQVKSAPASQVLNTIEALISSTPPIDSSSLGSAVAKDIYVSAHDAGSLLKTLQGADAGFELIPSTSKSVSWSAKSPSPAPTLITQWPLTFLDGSLPSPDVKNMTLTSAGSGGLRGGDANTTAKTIADVLNGMLVAKGKDPLVTALGPDLLFQGSRGQVEKAKRILARYIDIPYSQVRLDIWTVQVNTKVSRQRKEAAQANLSTIKEGIKQTRSMINLLVSNLEDFVQQPDVQREITREINQYSYVNNHSGPPYINGAQVQLPALFQAAGIQPDHLSRPLTLAETLMFLEFYHPEFYPPTNPKLPLLGKFLDTKLMESLQNVGYLDSKGQPNQRPASSAGRNQEERLWLLWKKIYDHSQSGPLLRQMSAFRSEEPPSNQATPGQNGIVDFLLYWALTSPDADNATSPVKDYLIKDQLADLAAKVSQSSAAADKLLKIGVMGLASDLQDLFTNPLMAWIREDVQQNNADRSGLDLVGNASLVVDARMPVQMVAQAQSYSPFTPLPQFSLDTLNLAGRLKNDSAPANSSTPKTTQVDTTQTVTKTDTDTLTKTNEVTTEAAASVPSSPVNAGAALLGQLSGLEAFALAQALNQPETVYNRVSAGVSIGVRPTVLRDGGSARLQLSLVSNTDLDQPQARGNVPMDLIRGHSLQTDVAVNAFDLFELSTFATQTSRPGDYAWRVPVLDGLPLINGMFHGPQVRDTRYQESLIIVNVTILPRSLDLAGGFLQ